MEAINFNKKGNMLEAYGLRPTLPYDVRGTLVKKDARDIVVESEIGSKNISYSLKIRENIEAKIGEEVEIKKENILGINKEEKEKNIQESSINKEEVIKRLDLEDTEETRKAIEYLVESDIPVTKENLDSFFMSKNYLEEIIENMDYDSCIKLLDKDINLKEDSLQKIAEALAEVQAEVEKLSFTEMFNLDRKMTSKEAEAIAKEIYGRKMGKDVYDSIRALNKEDMAITKENIEKVMEIIGKLHDLKDLENEDFLQAVKEELPFNIESLYKLKHSYESKGLDQNISSPIYEAFTISGEGSKEDIESLLGELDIETTSENINLVREFFQSEVEVSKANFEKLSTMKAELEELTHILDEGSTARLVEAGIDPLKENISQLVKSIKADDQVESNVESLTTAEEILKNLEELRSIEDRELLELIKSEKDFKLENLREVLGTDMELGETLNEKTAKKAIDISRIFNRIGDLKSETISFAVEKYNTISLSNLYDSQVELESVEDALIETIDQAEENFIRQEYLNARSNTTLNIVRESIRDGVELQHIAIEELNNYADKKLNKYREAQNLLNELKSMRGREETLIPIVMRNDLNMSLGGISDLDGLLNSGKGLGNFYNNFIKEAGEYGKEVKEGMEILESKVKEFSSSLKEGRSEAKEEYGELLHSFKDLNHSFDSQGEKRDENLDKIEEYINLQNKISGDDLLLQLPMLSGNKYDNINLVIPNIKKGIDKNNMNFHLNMELENLGQVVLDLKVRGNEVSIDLKGDKKDLILENTTTLEEGLASIGYSLEKLEEKIDNR